MRRRGKKKQTKEKKSSALIFLIERYTVDEQSVFLFSVSRPIYEAFCASFSLQIQRGRDNSRLPRNTKEVLSKNRKKRRREEEEEEEEKGEVRRVQTNESEEAVQFEDGVLISERSGKRRTDVGEKKKKKEGKTINDVVVPHDN